MKLNFFVKGQQLSLVDTPEILSGTINYLCAKFIFRSADWEDVNTKWAHFRRGDEVYDMRLDANDCIPQSAGLSLPSGTWEVYLHGDRTTTGSVFKRITTGVCAIEIKPCGSLDGDPMPPVAPSATEQIEAIAMEAKGIAQSVRDDADNGAFIGKQGPVGPQGPIGPIGPQGPKGERGDEVVVELPGAGTTMVLNNSADAQLRNLRVYGESKQYTTTGKNLLNYQNTTNGYYTDAGILQGHEHFETFDFIEVKKGETFVLSCEIANADVGDSLRYALFDKSKNFLARYFVEPAVAEATTIHIEQDGYIRVVINTRCYDISTAMLEKGSVQTEFEPYTGSIPSPNPAYLQEIKSVENPVVKVNGKNLLNLPVQTVTHNGVTYTVNSDGSVAANGTATADSRIYHIIELEPNVEYVLTGSLIESNNTTHGLIVIDCEDYAEVWASYGGTATHFTPKNHTRFEVRVKVTNGFTANNLVFYPMVRYAGVGDNTFEPYTEQTLTIPYALRGLPVSEGGNYTDKNGQQWVCDTVDYERGVLVQRINHLIDSGSDKWVTSTSLTGRYGITGKYMPSSACLCSHAINRATNLTEPHICFVNTSGAFYINTDLATLDEWKAYLASNPIEIQTLLNTPIEIPLTAEELEAYAALRTVYPTTVVTNNHAAYMEASFVADPEILIRNLAVNDEKQRVVLKQTQVDLNERIKKFYTNNLDETHITDSDDGYMRHTVLSGKSEQFTTTGAQLYPHENYFGNNDYGLTWECVDGLWHVYGTVTKSYPRTDYNLAVKFPTGTYYCNAEFEQGTLSDVGGRVALYNSAADIYFTGKNIFTESTTLNRIILGSIPVGTTVDVKFRIMVNVGDKALPWQPYTGGIPSPNPSYLQEIKSVENVGVKVCGKNLFDTSKPLWFSSQGLTPTINTDGSVTVNGTPTIQYAALASWTVTDLLPTGTYFASGGEPKDGAVYVQVNVTKADGSINYYHNAPFTLDGTEKTVALKIQTNSASLTQVDNYVLYPILVRGDKALPYEPYTEQTVIIPYTLRGLPVSSGGNYTDKDGQQWICDEVDVERGVLVQRIGIINADTKGLKYYEPNGTKEFMYIEPNSLGFGYSGSNSFKAHNNLNYTERFNLLCNGLKAATDNTGNAVKHGTFSVTDYIYIRNDNCHSLVEYKAWMHEVDFELTYFLSEPIETPLSKEEVEAYKALVTRYGGTNILFESANGVIPNINFDYPCAIDSFVEYVKAQTGDTRQFVYNMEQRITDDEYLTALAYVNSEYAAALLELEV